MSDKRAEQVFPTNSLTAYNLSHDFTQKETSSQRSSAGQGFIGVTDITKRSYEVNYGSMGTIASQGVGYTHWLSGGEFTVPYPGLEAVVVSEHGKGYISGLIPPSDSETFYRLFYGTSLIREVIPDDESELVDNRRGGMPIDTMVGDHGVMSYDGYSYGILSGGPAFIGANPFCKLEFFDIDDTVKLHALNQVTYTGHGVKESFSNDVKNISNESYRGSSIVVSDDPLDQPDSYDINLGSVGNFVTYKSKINGVTSMFVQLNNTGDLFAKASNHILLKQGEMPQLGGPITNFDPSVPSSEDLPEDEVSERLEFDFLGKPNISQQGFFLAQSDLKYTRTFEKLQEEQVESYKIDEPAVMLRADGSLNFMSANGSTIEMSAEGDIIISPRRNLILQAGGDVAVIAGNEAHVTAGNNVGIHSTNQSVQVTGRERVQLFSRNQGVILETLSSEGIVHNATQGNYFINSVNYQQVTSSLATVTASSYRNSSVNYQVKSNEVIYDSTVHSTKTAQMRVEASQAIQMNSLFYFWGGRSLIMTASTAMVIQAGTPVLINHEHREGSDIFGLKRCGEGCRVRSIVKPPVGTPNLRVDVPSLEDIAAEDSQEFELQQVDNEDLEFFTAPWQPLADGGGIPGINNTVKGQNVFPTSYRLFTVTDSNNVSEIDWSQFRIS